MIKMDVTASLPPALKRHSSGGILARLICGLALLWTLSGCASLPDSYTSDPLEPVNRDIYAINKDLDNAIVKPVAKGYRVVVPDALDKGVTNFFGNIADINSAINNLLQLKPLRAASDVGRVSINTTIGMLGLFDVASRVGLKDYKEDMGQTLGYWGIERSPYLVIPLLGPNNLRDFVGQVIDSTLNPIAFAGQTVYWSVQTLRLVDARADLLETTDVLDEAAVDPYSFVRETYQQIRRNKIYDGEPPLNDKPFEDELMFEDEIIFDDEVKIDDGVIFDDEIKEPAPGE
jgi:phospholipid-binding lipoprotein MlaA